MWILFIALTFESLDGILFLLSHKNETPLMNFYIRVKKSRLVAIRPDERTNLSNIIS